MPATNLFKGVRKQGAMVNLAAAGAANAVAIYVQGVALVAQVGTLSMILKRIKVRSQTGGTFLQIGTGVAGAYVDAIPPLFIVGGLTADWVEYDVPETEFFATITAFPTALPGGGTMDVQVEVEERV